MKFAVLIFAALFLAACDPTQAEIEKVRAAMPPGCTLTDVGDYGGVRHLVIVRCDGRRTSTQSYQQQSGKTSYGVAIVQID